MVSSETVTLEQVKLLLAMAGHDEDRPRPWSVVVVHVAPGSCPSHQRKDIVMKLNHINLYSHDTEADRAMFEQYFDLHTLVVRGSKMAIMQDNDGLVLIVNHFENKLDGFDYPRQFDILHIGFIQTSREDVDALYKRLSTDGWEVQAPRNAHGAWSFYFRAKGGYFIEVTTLTPVRTEEAYQENSQ